MLGINGIIGAGIFLTPGAVIKLAGPIAPLAYILAGLFAGIMAFVFATAARYVKTNGASYAYTKAAFGQRIGIYVGVTHAIIASIAWGVLASLFVSTLLKVVFPDKPWADDTELFSVKTLTFLVFIAVLLAINLFGNRVIAWANGISTVGKIFALARVHRRRALDRRDTARRTTTGRQVRRAFTNRRRTRCSASSRWGTAPWPVLVLGHNGRAVRLHRFRIDRQCRRGDGRTGANPAEGDPTGDPRPSAPSTYSPSWSQCCSGRTRSSHPISR